MNKLSYLKDIAGDIMTVITLVSFLCSPKFEFESLTIDIPTIVKLSGFSFFAFNLINGIFIVSRIVDKWLN